MFGNHFQNIFSSYSLTDSALAARDACGQVVPCKVSLGDRARLPDPPLLVVGSADPRIGSGSGSGSAWNRQGSASTTVPKAMETDP
jgi:hypothetical protein